MKADKLLQALEQRGIHTIIGVPDSTLKQFCDGLQNYKGNINHYVPVNEGAAVGLAVGSYLADGKPACVYMQNSGIGNAVNPIASLANRDVYGIPMLFLVGWRGEPGVKDEPQHVFQGKITCKLFEVLSIPYEVIDKDTTWEQMESILTEAFETLSGGEQFAIIVRKGTFEKDVPYTWENGNTLNREEALATILKEGGHEAILVSTTGKISRELYEQSDALYGTHENIFMTVGGMGHASMIALGIAKKRPKEKIMCIDGDGAALMHMGALAFISSQSPENFVHIIINNQSHESVGAMPTGCQKVNFSELAKNVGYSWTIRVSTLEELTKVLHNIDEQKGPILVEVLVSLDSRADLGRPRESARENKEAFMEYILKK
ncbi:MAG TPA: phosphonopyruvate decarboxylase [Lachnospiraceae bacterium]|nr:phosphonopyruvate decarboxylase [Lachnospiraceae bacterium]